MPDPTVVPLIDLAERERHPLGAVGDGEEDQAAGSRDAGQFAQGLPFVWNMLEDRDRRGGPEGSIREWQALGAARDKEAALGHPLRAGKPRRRMHPFERDVAAYCRDPSSRGLDDGVGATPGTRVEERRGRTAGFPERSEPADIGSLPVVEAVFAIRTVLAVVLCALVLVLVLLSSRRVGRGENGNPILDGKAVSGPADELRAPAEGRLA